MIATAHILLHGFGQRFDLNVPLYLYLFGASGVVFLSFVLVILFAGDQVAPPPPPTRGVRRSGSPPSVGHPGRARSAAPSECWGS